MSSLESKEVTHVKEVKEVKEVSHLPSLTNSELIAICRERGIHGYSRKKKSELILMIRSSQSSQSSRKISNKSPLRYPGGKTRAIKTLNSFVQQYYPNRNILLSPFFGGGSFELQFATMHDNSKVYGNDVFQYLYTFWKCTQTNRQALVKSIRENREMTKEKFSAMRKDILECKDPVEIASKYFIINRCSFSGSTFCGGFSKESSEKRFTDSSVQCIEQLSLDNVTFSCQDCCEFLSQHPESEDTFVYADPPYYISGYLYGKNGDLHQSFDHCAFAECIQKRNDFLISYNDCEYIRNLYKNCRIIEVNWSYGMNTSKKSSEIIILPAIVSKVF